MANPLVDSQFSMGLFVNIMKEFFLLETGLRIPSLRNQT